MESSSTALRAAAVAAILCLSQAPLRAQAKFVRGDIDQNGAVELSDPVALIDYLFLAGPKPLCSDSVDADDNGAVELTDAIHLLNYLYLSGPAPRPPFPDCGLDPNVDPLGCQSFALPPACRAPVDCLNVVARAADRGCGRVFVWGDEHVQTQQYWPST